MEKIFKAFNALQVKLYRLSRGKLGGNMRGFNVLLLTTKGRKSGKTFTTPLGRFDQESGYVIVASNAGQPSQPAWYLNLKSDPHVMVQVMEKVMPATAEVLTGEVRARAWHQVISTMPRYADYEKRTTRQIPVILLHPN